jgi:hypothetical protein
MYYECIESSWRYEDSSFAEFVTMYGSRKPHFFNWKSFKGQCQLTGIKQKSAFVICRLDDANEIKVLPVASESCTWTEEDKRKAQELWEWGRVRILSFPTIRAQSKNTLGQIFDVWSTREASQKNGGEDADLTVMVTAIIPFEKAPGTAFGVLRVWDGTGVSESDP